MRRIFLLGCLMTLSLPVQAGDLYRWVDGKGKVQYGDAPPPNAAMLEQLEFNDQAAANADLPYETRRAQKDFPVTLYTANDCGEICTQARALLTRRGIPFSDKKLLTKEEIEAFKALSGSDIAPTLGVGKNFLKGFEAGQWNKELDIAGYPKTAPHPAPKAAPETPANAVAPAQPVTP
ncbi:MAG TPA: glutaredoxin family protein [Gallionella sp.]|nr:glutaredoxin family protein [Gallionella sp.]